MTFKVKLKYSTFLCISVILSACGGGSGSSSSSSSSGGTTPPPVADTTAPTVTFNPTTLSIESGQTETSTLTATDTVGVTMGPTVTCTNGGVFSDSTFSAPTVSQITQSICTASASDAAGNSASATLSVTINPPTTSKAGEVVGVFNPPLHLLIGNGDVGGVREGYSSAVFASRRVSGNATSNIEVVAIAGDAILPFDYDKDDIVVVDGVFNSVDFIQTPSLRGSGLPDASISILSSEENKLYWNSLVSPAGVPDLFENRETIDVDAPCYVEGTNTQFANDVIIGQKSNGLSLFDVDSGSDFTNSNNFTATLVSETGGNRSLCHFLRGIIPFEIYNQNLSVFNANFQPVTAIDYDTNEIVFFGDTNGDDNLEELGAVPLLVDSNKDLKIVDVLSRGSSSQVPRYFLILLTDGEHNGDHRLVLVSIDSDTGELEQEIIYAWNEGVPIGMAQSQFGGSLEGGIFRTDLIVVLGTTEQSLFFDNLRPLDGNFSDPPIYREPVLFEVGLGAGSVVAGRKPDVPTLDEPDYGILVSFPENGEVRYISPEAQ